jgi:predicted ferric reductase
MQRNIFKLVLSRVIIVATCVIPVLFWLGMKPLSARVENFTITLTSLGQLAGLVGMSLFAVNLIMAARLKFFEDYFNGINQVYISHHSIGAIAFSLLLFHPVMLAIRYLNFSSSAAAAVFLPSFADLPKSAGILALLIMIVTLLLTFYWRPRYNFWKITHKSLGVSFFIAGLHMFFIPSDIAGSLGLRYYMISLAVVALVAYSYRSLFWKFLVNRFEYKVIGMKRLKDDIVEITMDPVNSGKVMKYKPGQFIFISFLDVGNEETHPFSLVSVFGKESLKIGVKILGDYTRYNFGLIKQGTKALIEGPFGRFDYSSGSNRKQVWIAGGIGVTPFVGMIKRYAADETVGNLDLYYCVRNEEEAVYLPELTTVSGDRANIRIIPFFSDTQGRLTAKKIKQQSGLNETEFYLCAPAPMMKSLRAQLRLEGVANYNIHSEDFEL